MSDPLDIVIRSDTADEFMFAMTRVSPLLPKDLRRPFAQAHLACLRSYGIESMYAKLNGMTVREIMSHHEGMEKPKVVARGTVDGMTYELSAPAEESNSGDS